MGHKNKHIRAAVKYALDKGWALRMSKGHAWGRLYCPCGQRGGCLISVASTPRNPADHADYIRHQVDACSHC